jgi:hypothetical protein
MKQKQNKQRIPDVENCPMRARIKRKQIKNKKLDGKDTKRCDTAKASSIAEARLMKIQERDSSKDPDPPSQMNPKTLKIVAVILGMQTQGIEHCEFR